MFLRERSVRTLNRLPHVHKKNIKQTRYQKFFSLFIRVLSVAFILETK